MIFPLLQSAVYISSAPKGVLPLEACAWLGIARATYYRWKAAVETKRSEATVEKICQLCPTGHFLGTITGAILGGIVGGITAAIQKTNIKAGIAGGAVTGAIGGAFIDATIATAGGAIGGAAGDFVNQAGNNLAQGKSATSDLNVQSILINAGIGAASGVLGGATAVVMRSFEDATKKVFQGVATNPLKSGDNAVLNNSISNVHKAAVKSGNSNATIEYTTTVVYSAASNTVVYMVNNQVVQTIVVNVNQVPTQNAKQTYTKSDGTVIRVQKD